MEFFNIWYKLDNQITVDKNWLAFSSSWKPLKDDTNQWIQVSTVYQIVDWSSVIIQGRQDQDEWVTAFKVSTSIDGINWKYVEDGRTFKGNTDRNTRVTYKFKKPVSARALRIHPVTWNKSISLRFDATYFA